MSKQEYKTRKYLKARGVELNTFEQVYYTELDELFPTIAVVVKTETGRIGVGASVCSPDDQLDFDFGVKQARDRAVADLINGLDVDQGYDLKALAKEEAFAAREEAIQKKGEWLERHTEKTLARLEKEGRKYGFALRLVGGKTVPANKPVDPLSQLMAEVFGGKFLGE